MATFFTAVSRINSLLLLLIILGVGAFLASSYISSTNWQRHAAVNIAPLDTPNGAAPSGAVAEAPVPLQLDRIENISGSDTQMIELTSPGDAGKFSSGSMRRIRNILFISDTSPARWLFKTNRNLIVTAEQLGAGFMETDAAIALCVEYVPGTDAGAAGTADPADTDRANIALTRPDGTGFTDVLTGLDRVFAHKLKDAQHLSVIYQRGAELHHARITLATLTVESDELLANLPGTI